MTAQLANFNRNDDLDLAAQDIEKTQRLCQSLMKTPHYSKMGEIGVFTIVQKACGMGLNVLDALNGAMYFVNGKVELVANTMNYLIRSRGHSIRKDEKSDQTICILHGKRADNGDCWTSSFSIEDAKRAGIYRGNWEKYPEDMLFARALSRLARQLFPDVIKGCYVEGEIRDAVIVESSSTVIGTSNEPTITPEEVEDLKQIINECSEEAQDNFWKFLKRNKINVLTEIPVSMYQKLRELALKRRQEFQKQNQLDPMVEYIENNEGA